MATTISSRMKGKARNAYFKLVQMFPLLSVKTARQFNEAQKVMDGLFSKGTLGKGEEMYLDALSDLVAAYESQHHPIEPASDADVLRHLMEAKSVNQATLHRETGIAKSTISEVLAGKKMFSRQMIRIFAEYFNVDVSIVAANF